MRIADAGPSSLLRSAATALFDSPPANRVLGRHRNRLVDAALARGLTPPLEPPLRALASGRLPDDARRTADRIEARRMAIAALETASAADGGEDVSLRRAALKGSVSRRFGSLLHMCVRATGARTVIELGSCVGIGTSYLASAGAERVISIEASPVRAAVARESASEVGDRAEVVVGRFADVLPGVLDELDSGVDMAWIDGHHRKGPTLRYLDLLGPHLNDGAVLAFDDIRVSAEMRETWESLLAMSDFADVIDLDQLGLAVWQREASAPRAHDLRGITGRPRWLHGRHSR